MGRQDQAGEKGAVDAWARGGRVALRRMGAVAAVVMALCGAAAAPAAADMIGDPGWTEPVSVVGTTGAIDFTPSWHCTSFCLFFGGSTHFTAAALNGATFTPGSTTLRFGTGTAAAANCTVTTTLIDCVPTMDFAWEASDALTPLVPFALDVPASTPEATRVVELGWHDTGWVDPSNDPANDTQAVLFLTSSGFSGDWGHDPTEVVRGPGTYGTYGNDIGWKCLSATCIFPASMQLTAIARNGATFADPVGSQLSLVSDTAAVGICTVVSDTSLTCTPDAEGVPFEGQGRLSTSARYTVPAGLPDRTPVLEIGWSAPGGTGNDPSNDTLTVLAVTGAAPHEPAVVFGEGFEHDQDNLPTLLPDYVGQPPLAQTYTADLPWLQDCNGLIISMLAPDGSLPPSLSDCSQTAGTPDGPIEDLRSLSWALGTLDATLTGVDPNVNHTVTAYTQGNPGAPFVELETVEPIAVTPGHFYTAALSVAARNCAGNAQPMLAFNLLDGASVVPAFDQLANPCTQHDRTVVAPNLSGDIAAARFTADSPVIFQGNQLGLQIVNHQASGAGNDAAIDNLQLLDVTPRLEKAFAPAAVVAGEPATLTLTVVNSTDRLAKAGWSFTDTLPQGLRVADPATVDSTCPGTTVDPAAGGGAVAVTGGLASGQTDCSVTLRVAAAEEGVYENCAANVTNLAGMLAPGSCARLTVTRTVTETPGAGPQPPAKPTLSRRSRRQAVTAKPRLRLSKTVARPRIRAGETVAYAIRVTNPSKRAVRNVRTCDLLPAGLVPVSATPRAKVSKGRYCWTAKRLAAGKSKRYALTVRALRGARGRTVNRATARSSNARTGKARRLLRVLPGQVAGGGVTG